MDATLFRSSVLLAITWMACFSARAEHESGKWNCDGNQMEMNFCAAARFKHVDDEMNKLYRAQLNRLDEQATKARFREAQRAWVTFRDKACVYEACPREGAGSIWPLEHFGCMEQHTKRRIENLKAYLECTANGCPN